MLRLLRKIKFIFISICLILVLGTIVAFGNFSPFKNSSYNKKSEEVPATQEVKNDTTNILLLSDNINSMIIASIDNKNKDIKLTPVENTAYMNITDNENLLKSIEKTTKINLDKFLKLNISDLMKVVSILGDITVDIKEEDLQLINNLIPKFYAESTDDNKGKMTLISSPGVQKINEYQAMAYTYVASKDIEKQKKIIISLIENAKNVDFTKYMDIFNTLKPHVDTNLTVPDMLKLASSFI